MKYVIITTVKNEEKYIPYILKSIIQQTLLPIKWIIVDDNSVDNTMHIVEQYRKKYTWIETVNVKYNDEKKLYGSRIIKAFYVGLECLKNEDYDFLAKIDADLTLSNDYFQQISSAFLEDKKLGICGGYIIEKEEDFEKKKKQVPYIEGAIKSVTKKCFEQIGGFKPINGWDGLDQMMALYYGWKIKNIPIKVLHHRPTAARYDSLSFYFHNGYTSYCLGNDLLLTIIRSLVRTKNKPYYIFGAIAFFMGYLKALFLNEKRYVDKDLTTFIKKYNYKRITRVFRTLENL